MAYYRTASDIHLKVDKPPVFRIDGDLHPLPDHSALTADDLESLLHQITTDAQRADFMRDRHLDSSYGVPGVGRFRASILRQRGTVSFAFRLIPIEVPSIDALDLPAILKTLVFRPRGLILITGPAGSGKSTTMAAMINHLNENERRHVVTIEDPIEYFHTDNKSIIIQRELGHDANSYHSALVEALRHDPDVLVVGEMRDFDTIGTALTAAETGHLVLGTLHTTSAAQTIDRIIDVFPPSQQHQVRLQLSHVLEAVISQTLLPRVGGGRIVAAEILLGTPAVHNMIREEKGHQLHSQMHMGAKEGGQTLDQALAAVVRRGIVARQEAKLKSSDPLQFTEYLERSSVAV